MTPEWSLSIGIIAPLIMGLVSSRLPQSMTWLRTFTALLGPLIALIMIGLARQATGGAATNVIPWIPEADLGLSYLPDGLGTFFGVLVAGFGLLIVLYARGYFGGISAEGRRDLQRFYPILGFFATAMLGLVLADHIVLTVVFWELTSISSFLLIGWDRENRGAVKLAVQAFTVTGLGGMFLFGGVLLMGVSTDLWRWSEILAARPEMNSTLTLALGLMLIGACAKSAQWPLHFWLPGAMAAPTPVSAYLHSATMVKAGVFLAGRMYPVFHEATIWMPVLAGLGGITMFYGALMAVTKDDLKQIFAYTTVSQLGLLMAMYGLGGVMYEDHYAGHGEGSAHGNGAAEAAMLAAIDLDILQIANHALYKAPLFIIAGAIGHLAGTRDLSKLNGLFHRKEHGSGFTNKAMVITLLLAGYALAAGPGTVSFQAKEIFLYAIAHAASVQPALWWLMALTVGAALCNVAVFVRLTTTLMGWKFGLGESTPADDHAADHAHANTHDDHHAHEGGLGGALIWLPGLIIVSMQYFGGLVPPLWNALITPLETNLNYKSFTYGLPMPWAVSFTSLPLYISLLAITLGVALGLSPALRKVFLDPHNHLFPLSYRGLESGSRLIFRFIQGGKIHHYIVGMLAALVLGLLGAAMRDGDMLTIFADRDIPSPFEYLPGLLLGGVVCVSALCIPLVRDRLIRVMLLGSTGMMVLSMYLIYQAPDLALTQLMVEIISVVLFVYVLRMLPDNKPLSTRGLSWRLPISLLSGLAIAGVTLVMATTPTDALSPLNDAYPRLGDWFAAFSYEGPVDPATGVAARGGGGNNIVNVILVDFRGFDTMGEICVLGLAAMGVWALVQGRGRRPSADFVGPIPSQESNREESHG